MPVRPRPRFVTWMPELAWIAALVLTACPIALPANDGVAYRCAASDQCPNGQLCRDQHCVATTAPTDAGGQPLDAAASDAAAGDALINDARISDLVRDVQVSDRAAADRSSAPDTSLGDAGHVDAAAPDRSAPDTASPDACAPPSGPAWWDPGYGTRYPIAISAVEQDYTIELVLAAPTGTSVHAASLALGDDLRIVRHAGGAAEIDRERTRFDIDDVVLRFRIQESGGYAGGNQTYFLYVGNASPATPAANPRNVYLLFEDFKSMAIGSNGSPLFTPATAEWSVVDTGSGRAYRVNAASRSPAAIDGISLTGGVFAGWVKYNVAGTGTTGYTGLAFRCSNVSAGTTTCTGGAVRDASDQSGIMSWTGGTFDYFGITSSTFSPQADVWYHYQVAFVGNSASFWINGAPQETASAIATSGTAVALVGVGVDAEFDDITLRKLADPEPTVALGSAQQRCQ